MVDPAPPSPAVAMSTVMPLTAGRLLVRLTSSNLPTPARAVILRLRGSGTERRIPLPRKASAPVLVDCTAATGLGLVAGIWDVFAEVSGEPAERIRITSGPVDVSVVYETRPGLMRCRAYRTEHGNLSLRVRHLDDHAEVGRVTICPYSIDVRLGLPAHVSDHGATLMARERGGSGVREWTLDKQGAELVASVPLVDLAADRSRPDGTSTFVLPRGRCVSDATWMTFRARRTLSCTRPCPSSPVGEAADQGLLHR